ncbi:N-methyl-L-tryptophan oxidase [Paenibacillus taichungensis]|uniref:N-methyl-L-tryptophan oxidase n=1 Tax=Paenibacillus taichungensis TaxID=484184 RepID=A0ABX2MU59_9BACL|nr:N-methyl-L-tryptophan oxidase [Paenibacillus taichungensis]NUU57619.1 N-methyl-L-tryptophan oxidase [Paenibacillus taichungensis]
MVISHSYDVIIVGAGSMGMSAGYYLARSGLKTLLIDAFDPPHTEGSHHGEPRLIRHVYSGGPDYIAMALLAQELWEELEDTTGAKLLVPSGVLNIVDPDIHSFHNRLTHAEDAGIRYETLRAAEIMKRWPGIEVPEHYEGMYEPDAGYLFSERCVLAFRQAAEASGATILTHTRVEHIDCSADSVGVITSAGETYYANQVILSAGAWFQTLKPFVNLPIRAVRKTVGWFDAPEALFAEDHFPGFTLAGKEGGYYGFPSIGGSGLKIGRHDTGREWTPGDTLASFGSDETDEGDLRRLLELRMPLAAGKLKRGAVCKYELTPDEDFIIDRHPAHNHVWLAGGFSGHGFKFSSAVGKILSDLMQTGHTDQDIGRFALSRFGSHISR